MKLQSVVIARSIWLFSTSDLNPRGKALLPILAPLVQRYNFINFPKTVEQLTGNEFKFESGQFTGQAGEKIAVDLAVYNDGLVADTRSSTEDSDFFLHDFMTWLHEEHGLLKYETVVRKKVYVSELYVTCEQLLNNLNPGFMELRDEMSHHDSGFLVHDTRAVNERMTLLCTRSWKPAENNTGSNAVRSFRSKPCTPKSVKPWS